MLKDVMERPEYKKLVAELPYTPMFATLGGSYAYGTNIETSDIDLRGIVQMDETALFADNTFEQYIDKATDTTFYSFNKVFGLMANCNPNVIEMLGCQEFYANEAGKLLYDNRGLFLSQKAIHTFMGYAQAQLIRLENALDRANAGETGEINLEQMRDRLNRVVRGLFSDKGDKAQDYAQCYIEKGELYVKTGVTLKVSEAKHLMSALTETLKDYDKMGNRNHKKDDAHLCKHAMHLIRLYYMLKDILKGKIVTYRTEEHDTLMAIRNGEFFKDNKFTPEFYELHTQLKVEIEQEIKNTALPKVPDRKKLQELQIEINKMSLKPATPLVYHKVEFNI